MIAKLFLIALTAVVSAQAALSPAVSDADCKTTASCLRYPKNCKLADCDAFIKWVLKKDHLVIEMRTKWSSSGNHWVAFSVSDDEDMDKNPTEFCYTTTASTGIVGAGYHTAKTTPSFLSTPTYISNSKIWVTNNALECRFDRALKAPAGTDSKYSIRTDTKYYYLGGYGKMASLVTMSKHVHDFHSENKMLLSGSGLTTVSITAILLAVSMAIKNVV